MQTLNKEMKIPVLPVAKKLPLTDRIDNAETHKLLEMSRLGRTEVVCSLLTAGVDFTAKGMEGRTALINATVTGRIAMVWLLVDKAMRLYEFHPESFQAYINAKDDHGNSAFEYAKMNGFMPIAELLVECGAK